MEVPKWSEILGTPNRLGCPHIFQNYITPGTYRTLEFHVPPIYLWVGVNKQDFLQVFQGGVSYTLSTTLMDSYLTSTFHAISVTR